MRVLSSHHIAVSLAFFAAKWFQPPAVLAVILTLTLSVALRQSEKLKVLATIVDRGNCAGLRAHNCSRISHCRPMDDEDRHILTHVWVRGIANNDHSPCFLASAGAAVMHMA